MYGIASEFLIQKQKKMTNPFSGEDPVTGGSPKRGLAWFRDNSDIKPEGTPIVFDVKPGEDISESFFSDSPSAPPADDASAWSTATRDSRKHQIPGQENIGAGKPGADDKDREVDEEEEEEKADDELESEPIITISPLRVATVFLVFVAMAIAISGGIWYNQITTKYYDRYELDRVVLLPTYAVKSFLSLYWRYEMRNVKIGDKIFAGGRYGGNGGSNTTSSHILNADFIDLNNDGLDDRAEAAIYQAEYGQASLGDDVSGDLKPRMNKDLLDLVEYCTSNPHDSQCKDSYRAGAENANRMFTIPHAEFMNALESPASPPEHLCDAMMQYDPVKNVVKTKKGCWDVLYFLLIRQFSPWDYTNALDHAISRNVALKDNKDIKRSMDAVASTVVNSNISPIGGNANEDAWKSYEGQARVSQCFCSHQLEFWDRFVMVCDASARRQGLSPPDPICKLYIHPQIRSTDDNMSSKSTQNSKLVGRKIVYTNNMTHLQELFDKELGIKDDGWITQRHATDITYYMLPSESLVTSFYGQTFGNPVSGVLNMYGKHEEVLRNGSTNPLFRWFDTIRHRFIKPQMMQHAVQDVIHKRQELSIVNSLAFQHAMERKTGVVMSTAEWWQSFVANALYTPSEQCKARMKTISSMSAIPDAQLRSLTTECLSEYLLPPRLIKTQARVSGYTSACLLHCQRTWDLMDTKFTDMAAEKAKSVYKDTIARSAARSTELLRSKFAYKERL